MKRFHWIALGALALAGALSLGRARAQTARAGEGTQGAGAASRPAESSVRSIALPTIRTDLPPGPSAGRDTVGTACTFCHSTRYILNQPPFPRQTWTNEVNKMRTVYGAPIAEQQVPAIVDYLASIRGAPEPKSQP